MSVCPFDCLSLSVCLFACYVQLSWLGNKRTYNSNEWNQLESRRFITQPESLSGTHFAIPGVFWCFSSYYYCWEKTVASDGSSNRFNKSRPVVCIIVHLCHLCCLLVDDYPTGSWLGNEDTPDQRVRVPILQRWVQPVTVYCLSVGAVAA